VIGSTFSFFVPLHELVHYMKYVQLGILSDAADGKSAFPCIGYCAMMLESGIHSIALLLLVLSSTVTGGQ
jgi:hypothetical protein